VVTDASITELLGRASSGSRQAEEELLERIYDDLRHIARRQLRSRPSGSTSPATALAHEIYIELVREKPDAWPSRQHFFAAFARALHNHLIDRIRRKAARGRRTSLSTQVPAKAPSLEDDEFVALREHLEQLDRVQPRAAEVFRVHFLTGLTIPEIATTFELGHATVERDLVFARTWLHRKMRPR